MNKHIFYPLSCALINAFAFLLNETVLRQYGISPLILSLAITFFGGLFLLSFLFLTKKEILPSAYKKKDILLFLLSSFFAYSISFILAFYSITAAGGTKFSFALLMETVFIILLAFLFLGERLSSRTYIGGFFILGGGFLLNFSFTTFQWTIGLPDILSLLAVLSFSIGIVITTALVKKYDPLIITAGQLLTGSCILFLFFLFSGSASSFSFFSLTKNMMILLVLSGIFEGIIWLLYNKGLQSIGAATTSILFSTLSFFTLLFSFVFNFILPPHHPFFLLPENIHGLFLGGILMFCGVMIIHWKKE